MRNALILLLIASAGVAAPVSADDRVLNLMHAPFSAAGDGAGDDRAALGRALAEAKPGDTLLVPAGDYRIVLTAERLSIPAGVTILGWGGKSRFLLSSSGGNDEHREFLHFSSNVTLE